MSVFEITRPVMRYHGGKFRLAPWILGFFPPHKVYCEPFGGVASVLLQKPRSHGEIYNDLDGDMVNIFRVLQNDAHREKLIQQLAFTPYAREEFNLAWEPVEEPVERARRTFIRAEMGFGSASASKGKTGFRVDTVRNYGTAMTIWGKVPEKIAAFADRLRGVLIENMEALHVIGAHDTPHTLFYVDPPYVHSAREVGARHGRYYRHEMTDADHSKLLDALKSAHGMVVISGYPCELYEQALKGWARHETLSRIAAARGTKNRTEVVWLNESCRLELERLTHQTQLFTGASLDGDELRLIA